jgi:glycosyltransferase 2 family protein
VKASISESRFARRTGALSIKLAITVVLLLVLFRGHRLGDLVAQLAGIDRTLLALAAGGYWCVALPSALRWSKVVEALGYRLGFRRSLQLVLIGYFFNQTLVSSVGGDGVRMWMAYRGGLSGTVAVVSVLIDRAMQYVAHMLIILAAVPAVFALIPDWRVRAAIPLLLGGSAVGLAVAACADRLPRWTRRLPFVTALFPLAVSLRRILLAPRYLLLAVGLGLANQIGGFVVVWLLGIGLGLPISWLDYLLVVPLAMLMTALPISVGGWGVREGSFVAGFALVGVSSADALALSVAFGLLSMAVRLPGGLIWMASSTRRQNAEQLPAAAVPPVLRHGARTP